MTVTLKATLIPLLLCWGSLLLTAQDDHNKVVIVNHYDHKDYYNYKDYNYEYRSNYQHSNYRYNKERYAKLGVYLEKDETSILIKKVSANSAAAAAGLQAGDRLLAFDQVKVWSSRQLTAMIRHKDGGETVRVDYQRDGQILQTNVTLDQRTNSDYRVYDSYESPCAKVEKILSRPFLGVYLDRSSNSNEGARITSIIKNTGAAASTLQAEDRIIGLDGEAIRNSKEVHQHIQGKKKPTEPMQVEVLRDNQRVTLTAIVGSWGDRNDMRERLIQNETACATFNNPASACSALQELEGQPFLGIYMTDVQDAAKKGALITSVIEGTQAAESALRGGDLIVRFDGVAIGSHSEASKMILSTTPNDPVQLQVLRGDQLVEVAAVMGSLRSQPSKRAEATALEEVCDQQVATTEEVETPKATTKPSVNSVADAVNLTLFPNPSSDYVNVVYEGQKGSLVVSITTLDGKSVYDQKVPSFEGVYNDQINVNNFPAGIYVLYITQGEVRTSKQLIVE